MTLAIIALGEQLATYSREYLSHLSESEWTELLVHLHAIWHPTEGFCQLDELEKEVRHQQSASAYAAVPGKFQALAAALAAQALLAHRASQNQDVTQTGETEWT